MASAPNIYRCTPRQTRASIIRCIESGLVPFVQSSPGMGKSTIMRSIADEFMLHLIDHRLSTSAPEDLSGLPEFYTDEHGVRRARFVPFDLFPVANTPIPPNKDGFMLFLDEANSGTKQVQAACYKLILDKMTGQFPLHPNCAITMAGNLTTDRAIVNPLSTAMQSRVIHIEMQIDFGEWLEDVAIQQAYDERIIAFLNWKEPYLMDFNPDHNEKTFCCPRTWEFMNNLIKNRPVTDNDTTLFAGAITSGVAVEFTQFCEIYKDLTKIEDVLRDPTGTEVPHGADRKWAVVSHLMGKVEEKTFPDVAKYINRFDLSFRVLFYRTLIATKPMLRNHPTFAQAMVEVNKYLHGN
jgi:hypothetical protein